MMKFEFYNPTRLIFGAGSLGQLGKVVNQYGKKALLVIGGGSVKKSGAFDRAVASLKAAGVLVVEFSGVEPNPRLSTVVRASELAKKEALCCKIPPRTFCPICSTYLWFDSNRQRHLEPCHGRY